VRLRANEVRQGAEVDALSSFDGFYAECRGEIAVNYYRNASNPLVLESVFLCSPKWKSGDSAMTGIVFKPRRRSGPIATSS